MTREELELSAPWYTYRNKIDKLFGEDPAVTVKFNEENREIRLYVDDPVKAYALSQLLPAKKDFGSVTVTTTIIPANLNSEDKFYLLNKAFEGNPAFSFSDTAMLYDKAMHFIVFKNKVVQFFNDQLDDIHGNISTLYQEIAKDVLGSSENIFYCTDLPEEKVNDDRPLIDKLREIRDTTREKFEN